MNFLQQYIQEQLGWTIKDIKSNYQELQQEYRTGKRVGYKDAKQIKAYVFTRFPATYAVCLELIERHIKNLPIKSILDWGCGIGTASLALSKYFSDLECFLIEQDKQAKNYALQFINHFYPRHIIHQDTSPKSIDLSICSYSLGEVKNWEEHLDNIWKNTNYLLIIEPGTTTHFQKLLKMRDYILSQQNAYLLGPCCHSKICPLKENDWCHFSINVPRSKEHRALKNARRGFEHEAYCYMFFSKIPKNQHNFGRLVAPPRAHGGHIDLKICTRNGNILKTTISKSSGNYKQIKKLSWGDALKNELPQQILPKQPL